MAEKKHLYHRKRRTNGSEAFRPAFPKVGVTVEPVISQCRLSRLVVAAPASEDVTRKAAHELTGQRSLDNSAPIAFLGLTLLRGLSIQGINQTHFDFTIKSLLEEFSDVFKEDLGTYKGPNVTLPLDPEVLPIRRRARNVPLAIRPRIETEIKRLLKEEVLEPIANPKWSTPVVPVIKPSGDLPVDDASAEAQTIITHLAAFKVKRLRFGVSVAPGIFQQVMDDLLRSIPGTTVYFDDVLVRGSMLPELRDWLRQVLQVLRNTGLRARKEKCLFGVTSVDFLGYRIDASGIHPSKSRMEAIKSAPVPQNKQELQVLEMRYSRLARRPSAKQEWFNDESSAAEQAFDLNGHTRRESKQYRKEKRISYPPRSIAQSCSQLGVEGMACKIRNRFPGIFHKTKRTDGSQELLAVGKPSGHSQDGPTTCPRRATLSHTGIVSMKALARSYVWWPNIIPVSKISSQTVLPAEHIGTHPLRAHFDVIAVRVMKMVTVEDFPDHILELIFSFLSPYAELDACMCVCKRWYHMVKKCCRKLQFNFRELRNLEWFPVDQLYSTECANIWSRFAHAACYHKSGSIFVFGGMTSTFGFLNDIWKFNLTTRVWKRLPSKGDLPRPKASSSLIAYGDKLILFGGWCPSQWRACRPGNVFCDNLHCYCISTGAWTSIPSRGTGSEPLANHSASLIGDWMILFGGLTPSGCTNKIRVFDIRRKVWFLPLTSPVRPSPRCLHSQVILDDEHLLIVGGECMGKTNLFDVWLLTVGHENTIWQWEQLDVFTNEPSLPLLWSRQACKVGDKAIFLSCPHVERSAAQFQAAQTFFGINRSGSGRNDFRVFDRHDYSLPINRLSTVKMDAKPQVPATGRTQKRTDSSRKKENWKVGIPCTRPVNVYALHMDRVMSHRCVTWSIVLSSSHAPQDTFLGSVIEGRGEIVVFGGVRYVGDSSSPSFSSFFEQKHGAAVDTVFVLKSSLGKSIKPSSTY
ncbi:Kelch 4 and F-box-like and Kelch 3 and RVT 1 doma in containing protein [Trichuris trichiura]|uniref:Kelch 4 and F-box-like and Kelch 3 and RVT 1 doma in containing protein n=1 Tax=Trichuris trichiura TaxID=36087 RepID=A0A077ZJS6_TRITR|nr:Kelch 4 and F-box-like and Kelch 3 and RVT 1 doma in containing protein [Trichuris trichiura]